MKLILLSAQLISKVEQAIEVKIGAQYKESAFEQLDSNAGPWAITFLASHLWLADCAANGYKAIASRMQVPEWWLRSRTGEPVEADRIDVALARPSIKGEAALEWMKELDNHSSVTSASISEAVAAKFDEVPELYFRMKGREDAPTVGLWGEPVDILESLPTLNDQERESVEADENLERPVTSASISEAVATSLDDAQREGCILQDSRPPDETLFKTVLGRDQYQLPDEAAKTPEDSTHYCNKKNKR